MAPKQPSRLLLFAKVGRGHAAKRCRPRKGRNKGRGKGGGKKRVGERREGNTNRNATTRERGSGEEGEKKNEGERKARERIQHQGKTRHRKYRTRGCAPKRTVSLLKRAH